MISFLLSRILGVAVLPIVCGQGVGAYFEGIGIDGGDNLVYLLLLIFFGINFLTPVLYWLLRTYVQKWLDIAQERMVEIQQRITERISDAGRNFSEKVRA